MEKTDRLDEFLDEHDLAAVWFAQPNNFAWLTGADNVVVRGDVGVAAVGYDGDQITVVTNNIEANRIRDEETASLRVIDAPWYENSLADVVRKASPEPGAADFDVPGFERIDASPLRQPLTAGDVERYRSLADDVGDVLESVARGVDPGDTEEDAATRLRCSLDDRGIAAPVALVGGSERAPRYRHYTPKDVPIGGYALFSVTAVRGGLFVSASRTVAFDPPEWLDERTAVAQRVEATALAATNEVGHEEGSAADVFDAIRLAYAEEGWDGEWENHHQGGATGYAGREWFATPSSEASVLTPMPYAYNPTVQGAKSEDTALVSEEGIEILTGTGDWPTREVEAVGLDATIERHDVLTI